ncbi:unnamed protein product, partial [Laminaria digitata]
MEQNPILTCRRRSRSIWLHFPHLELLFLFWAFEGAVAAQVSAIRTAECPWVFWLALAALLLFPVLMIIMVGRTILVRVRPNGLLVFRLHGETEGENQRQNFSGEEHGQQQLMRAEDGEGSPAHTGEAAAAAVAVAGFWQKLARGWHEKGLLFSWADTGKWESVATRDEETKREADWFRIGFEPLFVDLSKSGCSYLVFLLLKWFALACAGVLVDDSFRQLAIFSGLHAVDLVVLVKFAPFANR